MLRLLQEGWRTVIEALLFLAEVAWKFWKGRKTK